MTQEILTPEVIEEFLESQERRGTGAASLAAYRRSLQKLYDYLPQEKCLGPDTGRAWKDWMEAQGVAPRSINSRLSALNSLSDFLGRREFQIHDFLKGGEVVQPELTREEYLRLLQAAKTLGKEKIYLLVKTLGGAGLRIQELPQFTAQAVQDGKAELRYHNGRCQRVLRISLDFQRELLAYIRRQGFRSGPVFRTAAGAPMARTYAVRLLQSVSQAAQVPEEKATPRCLWNMYCATRENIFNDLAPLADQRYAQMLAREQQLAGWDGTDPE